MCFRSDNAAQYLGEVFRERKVEKTYWSVVVGSPNQEEGEISLPLREHTANGRFRITLSDGEMVCGIARGFYFLLIKAKEINN